MTLPSACGAVALTFAFARDQSHRRQIELRGLLADDHSIVAIFKTDARFISADSRWALNLGSRQAAFPAQVQPRAYVSAKFVETSGDVIVAFVKSAF
jgi:hypothetical protein